MVNHCLMSPASLSLDELMRLSEQYQGIVFLNLGDESAPHFILDLVLELEREKIVPVVSPCEIFERSYLVENASGSQRDLVLLIKSAGIDVLERLRHWISCQASDTVMSLSDYVAEYKADFEDV